jgi:hypothetical protein
MFMYRKYVERGNRKQDYTCLIVFTWICHTKTPISSLYIRKDQADHLRQKEEATRIHYPVNEAFVGTSSGNTIPAHRDGDNHHPSERNAPKRRSARDTPTTSNHCRTT